MLIPRAPERGVGPVAGAPLPRCLPGRRGRRAARATSPAPSRSAHSGKSPASVTDSLRPLQRGKAGRGRGRGRLRRRLRNAARSALPVG
jgi:hypothetical protein